MKCCGLFLIMMIISFSASAGMVVVVNANSSIAHLSRDEVVNIFMGRYRKLSDGNAVQPLDIRGEAQERRSFYDKLVAKSLAEINAYWARLIFSGRTQPPLALNTQRDVLEKLVQDPNAIGYVESGSLTDQVKVVYRFAE